MANTDSKTARATRAAAANSSKAADAAKGFADAAFDYPKFEVPEMLRSFAEQGLTQTRDAYGRMKTATEEATGVLEESFETTRETLRDVQFKTLDLVKANADASFDLVRQLLTVTSVSDALQLQTSFARERFEALVDFSKEVQPALSKAGAEASKPAKIMFDRAMNQAAA